MSQGTLIKGVRVPELEWDPGVEVFVDGDKSRVELARRIVEHREAISSRAVGLLEEFMRDQGAFDLAGLYVLESPTINEGDFFLWYTFIADRDQYEYHYTYFHVFFRYNDSSPFLFWPIKFSVGFY